MSNSVNRREALMSLLGLCSIPGAITVLNPQSSRSVPAKFPGKPDFWFGDTIKYPWFYADEGKIHWEFGEVMGVIWHPEEEKWLYTIQWIKSTSNYTSFTYPNFDEYLTDGDDFELVTENLG